jgi:hypothetical protein
MTPGDAAPLERALDMRGRAPYGCRMRLYRFAFTVAVASLAALPFTRSALGGPLALPALDRYAPTWPIVPVAADRDNYDIDLIVAFSGKCAAFRVAGQNLPCRAVKYFHGESGRAYFTIAVDDPADKGRIVSFSGDKARRDKNDFYELTIDQVLLNSRERPLAGGVRVPRVEPASGTCQQSGDIDSKQIKSVSCVATGEAGQIYELQFQADGQPATVQRITREPLESVRRRARLRALKACRIKSAEAKILPRDATAYIIQCLEQGGFSPVSDDQ